MLNYSIFDQNIQGKPKIGQDDLVLDKLSDFLFFESSFSGFPVRFHED